MFAIIGLIILGFLFICQGVLAFALYSDYQGIRSATVARVKFYNPGIKAEMMKPTVATAFHGLLACGLAGGAIAPAVVMAAVVYYNVSTLRKYL